MREPRFEITNVQKMLSSKENPSSLYDVKEIRFSDLPPLGIPFPSFWMESHGELGGRVLWRSATNIYFVHTSELVLEFHSFIRSFMLEEHLGEKRILSRRSWLVLNEDRTPQRIYHEQHGIFDEELKAGHRRSASRTAHSDWCAPIYAMALLGCSNIKKLTVCPSRQQRRRALRKEGVCLVRYYVLALSAKSERRRKSNNTVPKGRNATSLHLCRGHFKRYIDKPLFGKKFGTYWWQPQMRGETDAGVVVKDYRFAGGGSVSRMVH